MAQTGPQTLGQERQQFVAGVMAQCVVNAFEVIEIDVQQRERLTRAPGATQRMLQIRNCEGIGDQIEGKLTGSILFRNPIEESRITLSLTIKPQPAFIEDHKNDMIGGLLSTANAQKRGVVFRISGTINNPRYVIR